MKTIYDVIVIGAGITGLTAAYLLSLQGLKVCVLEKNRLEESASIKNAGQIVPGFRLNPSFLSPPLSTEWITMQQCTFDAIHLIKKIVSIAPLDCHLIQNQYKIMHRKEVNIEKDTYCFSPLPYILSLKKLFLAHSESQFYEETNVLDLKLQNKLIEIRTNTGSFFSKFVIIASNGQDSLNILPTSQYAILETCLLQTHLLENELIDWEINDAISLFEKTVHYCRLTQERKLIFGIKPSFENHFENYFNLIKKEIKQLFPTIKKLTIEKVFSQKISITKNGLPLMGMLNDQVFYSTGCQGRGIATGTMAAQLIVEKIIKKTTHFDLFSAIAHENIAIPAHFLPSFKHEFNVLD